MTAGAVAATMMTMRAALERNSNAAKDVYGQPGVATFVALATVSCRVWSRTRRHVVDGKKTALVEEIRCGMPHGTDVTELDRIGSVTDRAGAVLWTGPLAIEAIQHKHTHIEMDLKRVQS